MFPRARSLYNYNYNNNNNNNNNNNDDDDDDNNNNDNNNVFIKPLALKLLNYRFVSIFIRVMGNFFEL